MVKVKPYIDLLFWTCTIIILCIVIAYIELNNLVVEEYILAIGVFSYLIIILWIYLTVKYLLLLGERISLFIDYIFISFILRYRFLLSGILAAVLLILSFYSICYFLELHTQNILATLIAKQDNIYLGLYFLSLGVLIGIISAFYIDYFFFSKKYHIPINKIWTDMAVSDNALAAKNSKLNYQNIKGLIIIPRIRLDKYNFFKNIYFSLLILLIFSAIATFFANRAFPLIIATSICCSGFIKAGGRDYKNKRLELGWLTFKGIAEQDWNNFISHYISQKKGVINQINRALLQLKIKKAEKLLKKYVSMIRTEDKYVILARIAYVKKKYNDIEKIFSEATKLRRSGDRLHYLYASALYSMGKYKDAVNLLEQRINSNEKSIRNAHLSMKLALNYLALNNTEKALKNINTASAIDPACPVSKSYKALILAIISKNLLDLRKNRTQKKYEDTKKTLEEAIDLINVAIRQTEILSKLKSSKYMSKCLKINFTNIRGYINYKLGKVLEAGEDIFYCIDRDKKRSWPFFHLGLISKRFGNYLEAHYYFSVAMSTEENSTTQIYKEANKRKKLLEKRIATRVYNKISHAVNTG